MVRALRRHPQGLLAGRAACCAGSDEICTAGRFLSLSKAGLGRALETETAPGDPQPKVRQGSGERWVAQIRAAEIKNSRKYFVSRRYLIISRNYCPQASQLLTWRTQPQKLLVSFFSPYPAPEGVDTQTRSSLGSCAERWFTYGIACWLTWHFKQCKLPAVKISPENGDTW